MMPHSAHHSIISSPVSSEGGVSPQQLSSPKRLSNLYQYHNAPEVAPAAGLEYDDSIHPYSDKYPVVNSAYSASTLRRRSIDSSVSSKKPPVIIFGMKLRTFFIVSFVVVLMVIGAAVGGALGRPKAAQAMPVPATTATSTPNQTLIPDTTSTTPTSTAITSTFNAPIPTYSVLNDCPQSNNTLYTTRPVSTTDSTTYDFTKHCDLDSPLSANGARTLSTAFVYSFNDCIQICASLNFWDASQNCTAAVFVLDGQRPANCFVGAVAAPADPSRAGASLLAGRTGVNVALLQES